MADSPRWCDIHQAHGDHHTDRCPRRHVVIEGQFGAKYEDGKIVGWFFYPTLAAHATDIDTDEWVDSDESGNIYDSPFWTALRDSDLDNMPTEWMEDGPPVHRDPPLDE